MRLTAYACSLGVVLALLLVSLAQAATESTLYAFGFPGSGDGMYPYCTPIFDANGNLLLDATSLIPFEPSVKECFGL